VCDTSIYFFQVP